MQYLSRVFSAIPENITGLNISGTLQGLDYTNPRYYGHGNYDINEITVIKAIPDSITELDLSDNWTIGIVRDLFRLFTVLPKNIRKLDLASVNLIDQYENRRTQQELVTAFLALPKSIKELSLRDNNLQIKSSRELIELFSALPQITTLDVSNNYLYRRIDAALIKILAALPTSVTTLDLSEDPARHFSDEKILGFAALLPKNIQRFIINGQEIKLDKYRARNLIYQVRGTIANAIANSSDQLPEFDCVQFTSDIDDCFFNRLINALQAENNAISQFVIALLFHEKSRRKLDERDENTGQQLIKAIIAYHNAAEKEPSLKSMSDFYLWDIKALHYVEDDSHDAEKPNTGDDSLIKAKKIMQSVSRPPAQYMEGYFEYKGVSDDEKSNEHDISEDAEKLQRLQPSDPPNQEHKKEGELLVDDGMMYDDDTAAQLDVKQEESNKIKEGIWFRKLHKCCDTYQSHLLKQWRTVLYGANFSTLQCENNVNITRNKLNELDDGKYKTKLGLIADKFEKLQQLRIDLCKLHRNDEQTTLQKITEISNKIHQPDFIRTITMHRDSVALRFIKNLTFFVSSLLCGIGLLVSCRTKGTPCFWQSHGYSFINELTQEALAQQDTSSKFHPGG
jgi:hypothetical protein